MIAAHVIGGFWFVYTLSNNSATTQRGRESAPPPTFLHQIDSSSLSDCLGDEAVDLFEFQKRFQDIAFKTKSQNEKFTVRQSVLFISSINFCSMAANSIQVAGTLHIS